MSKLLEQINKERTLHQISDLMDIKYGFGLPERDRIKGDIPVYASSGLVGFHNESKVRRPSIVIGRKGNVGSVVFVEKESYPIDTVFYVDEPKHGFDLKYLYYLLQRINLPRYGGDSAVPGLSRDTVYSLSVETPKFETQKKIAEILSAYDVKIENNNKIIKNLEATAQTIFNEWFVNFRFPGYEKVKMVESEMGEIPEGWKVKTFKDSGVFFNCRDRIGKFEGQKLYFDTSCIDGIEIVKNPLIVTEDNIPSRAQFMPAYNSVWFARMSNTYKVLSFDKFSNFEVNNYLLSSGMLGIKTEEKYLGFLFAVIKSKVFHIQKDSGATGSTQVSLTDDGFSSIQILFPTLNLIEKYSSVVNKYISHILNLQKENKKLKQSRDQLLAKLI